MENKLKEKFEEMANNNVPAFMIPVVVHHMQQAYELGIDSAIELLKINGIGGSLLKDMRALKNMNNG